MWEYCGMERTDEGLRKAIGRIRELRRSSGRVKVPGTGEELNQALERAGRVADFFELGELMCIDALHRRESCGGHFRAESQTADGEALRHDDEFPTWPPGSSAARRQARSCTRSPWTSSTSSRRSGATSDMQAGSTSVTRLVARQNITGAPSEATDRTSP